MYVLSSEALDTPNTPEQRVLGRVQSILGITTPAFADRIGTVRADDLSDMVAGRLPIGLDVVAAALDELDRELSPLEVFLVEVRQRRRDPRWGLPPRDRIGRRGLG